MEVFMLSKVEFQVSGRYALFSDPVTRIGGEKCSYQIPTYEALKGILSSVYWKPTIIWYIDQVRVMNPIRTQARSVKPIIYDKGGNSLSIYNYLFDVKYQVQAHFDWNKNRKDMEKDRDDKKHLYIAERMIEHGGRRDIFLGTRECQGYVESCRFNEGPGFYDHYGELGFDLMFHGFDYPDENGKNELQARFWQPKMIDGVIRFPMPDQCSICKKVRTMDAGHIRSVGTDEPGLLDGYNERRLKDELDSKAV
jgi:CRISPR-associated protein Cas5d